MPCGAVTAKENNIIRIIVPIIASMIDSCMPYCSKAGSESIPRQSAALPLHRHSDTPGYGGKAHWDESLFHTSSTLDC